MPPPQVGTVPSIAPISPLDLTLPNPLDSMIRVATFLIRLLIGWLGGRRARSYSDNVWSWVWRPNSRSWASSTSMKRNLPVSGTRSRLNRLIKCTSSFCCYQMMSTNSLGHIINTSSTNPNSIDPHSPIPSHSPFNILPNCRAVTTGTWWPTKARPLVKPLIFCVWSTARV